MTIDHTGLEILGSIAHSTEPGQRVTLYAGENGNVWAAAEGEEPHDTETPIGREATAWGGDAWDFWPGDSIRCHDCGQVIVAEDDAIGCGCHCPECNATL